jgi:hypothetical protein
MACRLAVLEQAYGEQLKVRLDREESDHIVPEFH